MRLPTALPAFLGASAALVIALPFVGSSCGRTACLVVSQADFDAKGCPSQAVATNRIVDRTCPGPILSVDGEGSYDGAFCCYPVTPTDANGRILGCISTSCTSCSAAIFGGASGTPINAMCDSAVQPFSHLFECVCGTIDTTCAEACANDFCVGNGPSTECLTCIETDSVCEEMLVPCEAN